MFSVYQLHVILTMGMSTLGTINANKAKRGVVVA